jgi:hypothetical protein
MRGGKNMSLKQRRHKSQKAKSTKRPTREEAEGLRIGRKAMRLYQTKLKDLLEPAYIGKFVAIEPDSGDYFVGTRMAEAMEKARPSILINSPCSSELVLRQPSRSNARCRSLYETNTTLAGLVGFRSLTSSYNCFGNR